ncbi:hypothetical protein [Nonomuraea candida]|uniref:hypothetical protein n=1 Tax=Nonomuraea candida TaxID=359159 RepID=UPI000A8EACFE|nr:hypothetical protein [Nonomuraea candida]
MAFTRTALLISTVDGALREITVDPAAATAAICRRDGGQAKPRHTATSSSALIPSSA